MCSYWYSTNGMNQRRLSIRHLSILDQAFERHARIQLFDDEAFGQNVPAIANPYQGTMTAGDLHFGLYRKPPMWRMSDTSLDTLILMDSDSQLDEALNNINMSTSSIAGKKNNNHNRHSDGEDNSEVINGDNCRMGDTSLDTGSPRGGRNQTKYKYIQRKRMMLSQAAAEENCVCCRIS